MLFIGISVVWGVLEFLKKKSWALLVIAFFTGMALQFGSATEYFYIPVLLIIFWWKRKLLPGIKTILLSLVIFGIAFLPQLFFEIRHPGVLSGPIINFLLHGKPGDLTFGQMIISRLNFFYGVIASKFWINGNLLFAPFFIVAVGFLVAKWKTFKKDEKFIVVLIFSVAPFLGTLFFNGNSGNVYDYYFTGYYFVLILFFSAVLVKISETRLGKIFFALFLAIFLYKNITAIKESYSIPLSDPKIIAYENQLKAIDWIYKDAGDREFNVDVYVPPVIPYAYRYLFVWKSNEKLVENQVPLLYTLSEVDSDAPDRIAVLMSRQERIAKIEKAVSFGGITVERRGRLK
jgi:hypothetical protein